MTRKFSLSQKALLLVAIPLGAELIFIAVLGFILKQVEQEARLTERARSIVSTANDVTKHAYDACTNLVAYNLSKSKVFETSYFRTVKQIPEDLDLLKRLVADDPEQFKTMFRIQNAANKALSLLNEAKKKADSEGFVVALIDRGERNEIELTVNDLASATEELLSKEKLARRADPELESSRRALVETVIFAGIAMNIIIAIILTMIFNRSTSRRFSALVENTLRLSSGKALLPKDEGADEIAHLDQSFREMAEARNEADRVKREFLEMVSHDIRTPLTSVTATLQLMERGVNAERLPKDLSIARRSITQVLNLLNELLDLHCMDAGKLELDLLEADVLELLNEAIEIVRPQAQARNIEIEESTVSATAKCDVDRLRQIFINLLSNAIKYSPDKGRIVVSISREATGTKVTISDDGPGIAPDLHQQIFERFRQTNTADDKVRGGKGLGLSICKALIEAHGGTIGVDSDVGRGSKFWITLPLVQSVIT